MKKTSLIILLLVCLGVSCSQNDAPVNDASHLTSVVLSSDKFKTLDVDIAKLNVSGAILDATPTGKKMLIIPAQIDGKNHAVLAILDDAYRVAIAAYIEVTQDPDDSFNLIKREPTTPNPVTPENPNPTPDPVSAAYHAGTFNGNVSLTASTNYRAVYGFYHSNLSGVTLTPTGSAATTDRCKGWTQTGGPLDCAGKALVNSGPISSAACYWSFGYCFSALVIDCWLTGC